VQKSNLATVDVWTMFRACGMLGLPVT